MSILIKGMEMPKTCSDCPFCIFTADEKRYIGYCNTSDDDYCCKLLDQFMKYDEDGGGVAILGKPDSCPLVEIPPHGRLIDADKFMKPFYDLLEKDEHACDDTGKEDYLKDKRAFKKKWFGTNRGLRIKRIVDEAVERTRKELYETFDLKEQEHEH